MEILDYFKTIGTRFWVLVLVPLIAGMLPLAWFLMRPAQFAAHATVIPTSLVGGVRSNQYRGSDADKYFASNVAGALRTNALLNQVSQQTGVPARQVRSGLSVKQLSQLRKALGSDTTYAVVKNTLTRRAAAEAGVSIDDTLLVGPTAIAFSRDPVAAGT